MAAEIDRGLGILAGGGSLPREIAESARAAGRNVHIVAIEGEADDAMDGFCVTHANWGQVGRMISAFRRAGCKDLVIVGRVRRPDLTKIKPDFGLFRAFPAIVRIVRSGGDDSVLRGVVRFFETHDLRIVSPAEAAPQIVIAQGPLGAHRPESQQQADIALGFEVIRKLGPYDIGQAVVVERGKIVAVEGAEGTDAMLARMAARRGGTAGERNGVLVKRPKPGQELRIDLPAIGPDTVRKCAAAKLAGIAVLAGHGIAVRRSELVAEAGRHGLFVAGCLDQLISGDSGGVQASSTAAISQLGAKTPNERFIADASEGLAVVQTLQPYVQSHAVIVVRGHVLALETGEGALETLARAGGLRQWGDRRWGRRSGCAVLPFPIDADASLPGAVAAAGLAGIAVCSGADQSGINRDVIREADRLGLIVAGLQL